MSVNWLLAEAAYQAALEELRCKLKEYIRQFIEREDSQIPLNDETLTFLYVAISTVYNKGLLYTGEEISVPGNLLMKCGDNIGDTALSLVRNTGLPEEIVRSLETAFEAAERAYGLGCASIRHSSEHGMIQ